MPHKLHSTTKKALMREKPPLGYGFTPEEIASADRMEVWASSFKDEGPDWTEGRLMAGDMIVAVRRMEGF